MLRSAITGFAAFALMTGAAYAQDTQYPRDDQGAVVHYHHPDPGTRALGGGVAGAGFGAVIGCLVTIPIGCAPGAPIGAAVGGGTGAIAGAATTPEHRDYGRDRTDQGPDR
jgi:hypothetical protein